MTYDREKLVKDVAVAMQDTSGGQPFSWENAARAALAIAEPVIAERMREKAANCCDVRSRDYARAALKHSGEELECVYTDKTGVCASLERAIRLIPLTGEGE